MTSTAVAPEVFISYRHGAQQCSMAGLDAEGGYVTVVIRGDVVAVNAAIEAAKPRVEELCRLIVCHMIARPSDAALRLLGSDRLPGVYSPQEINQRIALET